MKGALKISQNPQENTCGRVVSGSCQQLYQIRDSGTGFLQNNFFTEDVWTTASLCWKKVTFFRPSTHLLRFSIFNFPKTIKKGSFFD